MYTLIMKPSTITAISLLLACLDASAVRAQTNADLRPPPVSLLDAIKLAEHYSSEHKLRPLPQFLSSVRYIVPKSAGAAYPFGNQPYWEVTYELIQPMPASGQLFYVSIDKTVKFVPSE